jgi:hypothetical protein
MKTLAQSSRRTSSKKAAVSAVDVPRGGSDMHGQGVLLIAMGGGGLVLVGGILFGSIHGLVDRYEFEGDSLHATMK